MPVPLSWPAVRLPFHFPGEPAQALAPTRATEAALRQGAGVAQPPLPVQDTRSPGHAPSAGLLPLVDPGGVANAVSGEEPSPCAPWKRWTVALVTALSLTGATSAPLAAAPPLLVSAPALPGSSTTAAGQSFTPASPAPQQLQDGPLFHSTGPKGSPSSAASEHQVDFEAVYQAVPLLRPQQPNQHPAMRFEVVAPTTSADDLDRLAQRYATNQPTIDALLDRDTTPGQRLDIQRDLGILPPPLLAAAREAGVRIWVARRDGVEVPGRLFPADAPDPLGAVDAVVAPRATRRSHAADIRNGNTTGIPARAIRDPQAGDTLESLARLYGAGTPEQVGEYVRLAGQMNSTDGTARDPRRPLDEGERIKLPDLGYYQGQRYSISTLDRIRRLNGNLRDPRIGGQYQHYVRLLMVKANTLPDPAPRFLDGQRIIVHEFGHVADSLMFDDLATYAQHSERTKAIDAEDEDRVAKGDPQAFITAYARTNVPEHYAEAFEAYFTSYREDPGHRGSGEDGNFQDLQAHEAPLADLLASEMKMWEQGQVHPKDWRSGHLN